MDLIKRVGLPVAAAAIILTPLALLAQPPAGGAPGAGRGGEAGAQAGRGGGRGRGGIQVDRAAMESLFTAQCDSCHKNAERAPQRDDLAQRTADNVIDVLTNGAMKPMAANLTHDQIVQLAVYLTGRQPGEALPVQIHDVMCTSDTPLSVKPGDWTKIAGDDENTGFQKNPGLKAADVPKLKLKWAWAFRASSYGQPIVVGDHLFMTSGQGGLVSLDAKTGCVHWRNDKVQSRTTPMVLHRPDLSPSGWVTFMSIAGSGNQVAAYDLANGKELWISKPVETVGASHLTGTPAVYKDTVYVPVSGAEEGRSTGECCTFRGSLVALDAKTGAKKWQTYFITEPRSNTRVNRDGVQLKGPAGAAAWSSPTIDIKNHQVLVTTGNSTTDGPTDGTDAVIAIDLDSGKTNWKTQTYPNDNFLVNCTRPLPPPAQKAPNCPLANGPDYDYGASAILVTLGGKEVVLSGQKSGVAHAIDAKTGKRLWDNQVGAGSSLGGIEWGMATDGKLLYAPNSDIVRESERYLQSVGQMDKAVVVPDPKPGLTAIDVATGKSVWHYDTPQLPCKWAEGTTRGRAPGCFHGQSQAVVLIPGAVFSGSTNGYFRAFDAKSGKVLWDFDTTGQTYNTINGVKNQPGGSVDSMAATVAHGTVYVMSGYAGSAGVGNNNPNVLLAFSVDGK